MSKPLVQRQGQLQLSISILGFESLGGSQIPSTTYAFDVSVCREFNAVRTISSSGCWYVIVIFTSACPMVSMTAFRFPVLLSTLRNRSSCQAQYRTKSLGNPASRRAFTRWRLTKPAPKCLPLYRELKTQPSFRPRTPTLENVYCAITDRNKPPSFRSFAGWVEE